MSFSDIFKKAFLESVTTRDITIKSVIFTLIVTCILAAYVYFIYRMISRKTFYNKNFNISLATNTVIVAAVIMTIQSNVVISLGMVGALSIVRFRTAIKDPLDLTFLFWSISIGIICGAGLPGIAMVSSAVLTIGIFVLNMIPDAKVSMLLIISANNKDIRDSLMKVIKANTRVCTVKSQTMYTDRLDMIVEIKSNDYDVLMDEVDKIDGITRCSIVSHNGEVTF